jgi:hypothetical protein
LVVCIASAASVVESLKGVLLCVQVGASISS